MANHSNMKHNHEKIVLIDYSTNYSIRYRDRTSTPRQMKFPGKRLRTERQQNIAMTHTKYTTLQ